MQQGSSWMHMAGEQETVELIAIKEILTAYKEKSSYHK